MMGLLLPIALIVAAELYAQIFGVQSDSLAQPSAVAFALWQAAADGSLVSMTAQTLRSALMGLLLGGGLGLIGSIFIALFRPVDRLSYVSVELFRPIPAVALIPIAMLVFGLGPALEISIIAFGCFWPMLILGQAAIRGVHSRLIEVSRVLRFNLFKRVIKIVLPAAVPRLFVALRLSTGVALILAITVEITANPFGLGHAMMLAQQSFRPDLMLALLVWVGLLGWALNASLMLIQKHLLARYATGAVR